MLRFFFVFCFFFCFFLKAYTYNKLEVIHTFFWNFSFPYEINLIRYQYYWSLRCLSVFNVIQIVDSCLKTRSICYWEYYNIGIVRFHLQFLKEKSLFEAKRQETYILICGPYRDSDQPAHPRSLIRVAAIRLKKPCTLGYPKCAQWRFWSDCTRAQADLNLCWAHKSKGTFSDVAAQCMLSCDLYVDGDNGFVWRYNQESGINISLYGTIFSSEQENELWCIHAHDQSPFQPCRQNRHLYKQSRSRWDGSCRAVSSGSTLFAILFVILFLVFGWHPFFVTVDISKFKIGISHFRNLGGKKR